MKNLQVLLGAELTLNGLDYGIIKKISLDITGNKVIAQVTYDKLFGTLDNGHLRRYTRTLELNKEQFEKGVLT